MERLFRPAWHCVALRDDIPRRGDYVTVDLLGLPLLVQNQGDRIAAFHNVCAHRNAILARQPRGNMERITCGYHGWQYDRDGVACVIPGGEYFKPMKPREFALDRVRVEAVGQLVFACLDTRTESPPSFLGAEMHARLAYAFGPPMLPVDSWTVEYECNWKVLVENTLEDYHVTSIHRATAGETAPARQIEHTLGPNYNVLENRAPDFANATTRWLTRRMRPDAEHTYFQYISFPSLIFVSSPMSSHVHVLVPTSPTTCRVAITTLLPDPGGRPTGRILGALLRRTAVKLTRAFVEEDRTICNDVQRGLAAARFPGVLGAREERVHHFQEWLLAATGA
jgi:choline monooxygenase